MEAAPQQQTIGSAQVEAEATQLDLDMELPAPTQHVMQTEAEHGAPVNSKSSHASVPKDSDKLYTKIICCDCGIGEVLGDVVCGEHMMFFCMEGQGVCGLGGKGGCLKGVSDCELMKPEANCGFFEKFFCLKCGCVFPEKPFLVVVQKTIF